MPADFPPAPRNFSRRALMNGGASLLVGLAPFSRGVFAQSAGPETANIKLGYIALTDAAALIVAKEKGLFDKQGLTGVEILKQASWAALRDNLVLGGASNGIDGAHILSPLPYLMTVGKVTQGNVPVPMSILCRLNLECQGISVSNEFAGENAGLDAGKLKKAFDAKKAAGKDVKAAMTFPGGTHDLWLRYWFAAGGIDPDRDISTITVPPPQMVANMKVGAMDVFCVGEPWNEQLVNQNIGHTALATGELWKRHPEKALGLRSDWVEKNPRASKALLMAVLEAQQWCEKAENKQEMAETVSKRQWLNVPAADISGRLKGDFNYGNGRVAKGTDLGMKFWADNASFPFKSHDAWFIAENMRWGKLDAMTDIAALVAKVNRSDLWRDAAKALGVAAADIPAGDSRGVETFFDGKSFNPADPSAYLSSLSIRRSA